MAVKEGDVIAVVPLTSLYPVITVVLSYFILSEKLTVTKGLGIIPALAAYLAMNFTGASTYTSLSGVKKEMRFAIPLEISAGVAGVGLWLVSRFIA
jgi:acetyl-CoA decarbonylase/synthase complex subunit gamma